MKNSMEFEQQSQLEKIIIKRNLPGRRWRVLRLITDVNHFSEYMPNVKKSEVLEKKGRGAITSWEVNIDDLPMRWKQEDYFEGKTFSLHFKAIEGDLEVFEGVWRLEKGEGASTDVTLEVHARLGIPVFENAVGEALDFRIRKNFEMMLVAIEEKLISQRYVRVNGEIEHKEKLEGFVVMGHPYNFNHLKRYFSTLKSDLDKITPEFLVKVFELAPTFKIADIKNYRSETGKTVNGSFVLCPLIPDMALLSPEIVLPKVVEGCRIGERMGAGVLALGGFTSIVGEKYFDKLKSMIKIPITTGNAFTAAMALEGVRKACRLLDVDLSQSTVSIIGGTGDIGSACARVLVREVREMIITGRTPSSLRAIEKQLKQERGAKISTTLDNKRAVQKGNIIIAAASSTHSIAQIDNIRPGAIVCDVGYPKNIGQSATHRKDIFVFAGGLSTTPQRFDVGFDVGLPGADVIYGCFAEAIILSLEGRYENFSEGKGKLTPEKIELIRTLADKHGFRLAPFYGGKGLIDEDQLNEIRQNFRG